MMSGFFSDRQWAELSLGAGPALSSGMWVERYAAPAPATALLCFTASIYWLFSSLLTSYSSPLMTRMMQTATRARPATMATRITRTGVTTRPELPPCTNQR